METSKIISKNRKARFVLFSVLLCSLLLITIRYAQADESIDPCDFLPLGGDISSRSETSCTAQYASEPAELLVQINTSPFPVADSKESCYGVWQENDFNVYWRAVDFGDCGIVAEISYKGKPAPGYTGWMVKYFYDVFTVRVATSQDYPAYQSRINELAGDVEYKIADYLGDTEKEDEIISPDEVDEEPESIYLPDPDNLNLPDWVKEGQAYIDKTGTAIYVPDWLEWIKPVRQIRDRGVVIEPRGEVWVYNWDFRKWIGPIKSDTTIYGGDFIATSNKGSCRAVFTNSDGYQDTISVGSSTLLESPNFEEKNEYPTFWTIYKGIVTISHAIPGEPSQVQTSPFIWRTPNIVVGTRGTEFVVMHNPDAPFSSIYLISGELDYYNLAAAGSDDAILTAGQKLVAGGDGTEFVGDYDKIELRNLLSVNNIEVPEALDQNDIGQLFSDVNNGENEDTRTIISVLCCCLLCLVVLVVLITVILIIRKKRGVKN